MSFTQLPSSASAPSFPVKRVSCRVRVPFTPAAYPMQPVLRNAFLSRIASHRMFYPFGIVEGVVCVLLVALVDFPSAWSQTLTFSTMLALQLGWLLCSFTHTDRRLMRMLLSSFEWWFLMGNVVAFIAAEMYEFAGLPGGSSQESRWIFPQLFFVFGAIYTFSLDACMDASRIGRGGMLFAMLACLILVLIERHVSSRTAPPREVCLLYCGDTRGIVGSSLTNVIVFTAKYLLHVIFRPKKLIIISTRIECMVTEGTAERAESDDEEHASPSPASDRALQTMDSPLLDDQGIASPVPYLSTDNGLQ